MRDRSQPCLPQPQVCSKTVDMLPSLQHAAGMVGRWISNMNGWMMVRAADHENSQHFAMLDGAMLDLQ